MSEVAELERELENIKAIKLRGEQAQRLSKHRDFRQLILEGFCLHDAARYAQLSGDPAMSDEARADSLAMAQASGHLKRFLQMQINMASASDRNISEIEEQLAEIRTEEGAE